MQNTFSKSTRIAVLAAVAGTCGLAMVAGAFARSRHVSTASGGAASTKGGVSHGRVTTEPALPATLAATGLYADFATRTIATANRPFAPQYPLWTDGATKQRWIYLPSAIDGSNADAWQFPVGTKLWKQFSFAGKPAETRYIERTERGWRYATYVWSDDGADATVSLRATRVTAEVAPGVKHVAPGANDCRVCHHDGPLGFSALQLSPDRDPRAAHGEPSPAGALDLEVLLDGKLLRGYRGPTAPRIAASSELERAALGYLHGNCGGCHNQRTTLASLEMELASDLDLDANRDAVRATTIDRASRFAPARARIAPGAPDRSVVVERMRARDAVTQMPPLGTQLVDREGVELVSAWIAELK